MTLNCCKKMKKMKPLWRYFMSQNQTIWLVKRPLRPKRKNQTDKLLETTESVCCFYGCLPTCKKSDLRSIKFWEINLGIRTCAWLEPWGWHKSTTCFYVFLPRCKKLTSRLSLFLSRDYSKHFVFLPFLHERLSF